MLAAVAKPGQIAELIAEAGRQVERAVEFHRNAARDEELVCLKLALACFEEALRPVKDAYQECLTALQRGMADYGPAGSRYYHFTVELGNHKLTTLDSVRAFEEGFFTARRGEPISKCEKAYMIGYRYGEAVRKEV